MIILMGHSMGGAIAIEVAGERLFGEALKGLVVLDIVEGSALGNLSFIEQTIHNRPASFESLEKAICWAYRSRLVRNLESCRISIPGQLFFSPENDRHIWRTDLMASQPFWEGKEERETVSCLIILVIFFLILTISDPVLLDWYTGMSRRFLAAAIPKFLIVAGTDRLDTDLTMAQMMGKFQLVVLSSCGHAIQEDASLSPT